MRSPSPAAAPGQGAEIEIKLALPAGGTAALLRQLQAVPALARHPPVRQQVHNLYYDTPDQALRRQRAALRIRRVEGAGGPQWLQTLKTADAGLSALSRRGEWEVPVDGPALQQQALREAPPWRHLDPDGALFAALQPCFATDFERTRWTVKVRTGATIEVALDRGQITADGRTAPVCELELELLSGPPEALFRLAGQIARRVAVLPLSASKAQRGFALAQGLLDAPQRAQPPGPPRRASVQALAGPLLAEMFDQFTANLHALLAAEHPELVHQARVGWRRWRSALRMLRPALAVPPPGWPGLEPLLDLLGELRDLDVACTQTLPTLQSAYVAGDAGRAAAWAAAEQRFLAAAALQRKAVRLALQEPLTGQALLGITQWLEALADAPQTPAEPARRWARQRVARLHARWKAARRGAVDTASQHRARLLAKRLRYNIEALQPLLPGRAQRWRERASCQQDAVGALRDVVQAGVLAAQLEAPPEVVAFLRGVAVGLEPPAVPDDGV
ncbi:MAG: CHAD domain-containing protein [Giesbergeria sp.]|jgi:inorganic triphosphatase YgiF|nr:CHAD domain-containing protein [Giesbergeria sp.]